MYTILKRILPKLLRFDLMWVDLSVTFFGGHPVLDWRFRSITHLPNFQNLITSKMKWFNRFLLINQTKPKMILTLTMQANSTLNKTINSLIRCCVWLNLRMNFWKAYQVELMAYHDVCLINVTSRLRQPYRFSLQT